MKKLSYFVLMICSFVIFSLEIKAKEVVVINGYDVRVRSDATTGSSILGSYNLGEEFTLVDKEVSAGNGCDDKWYKIEFGTGYGYVCSTYATTKEVKEIDVSDYQEYSDYLKALGFPDSYIPYLVSLHASHPNWQFKPLKVDAKFQTIVNLEYDGYTKGWSLLEDYSGHSYDGYKSTDSWSYNYLTDTFSTNFVGGGSRWYAANKATISYYMDPRNFLNEERIFMFETLSYNKEYHTADGIKLMLKGTFMENGYADLENEKTFVDAFIDAAVKYNVSPYVLVSRVIQEVGSSRSAIVSGTVAGYEGYYNFYNIQAYGSNNTETINNGLNYAKSQGWDNQYKAIIGGAAFLADDYINAGQDTLYLQKWDLIAPSYVGHQYMQNIQAPYTESLKTYNGYKNVSLLDSSFVFSIPVLNEMPDKTSLPNSGSPNNYLSSLSVNGEYLIEKDKNMTETEFLVVLDSSTKSVEIAASKVNSGATIIGTGTVSISEDTTIPITVRAANGDERLYKINITIKNSNEDVDINTINEEVQALDIAEILRLVGVKNDGDDISGLALNTKYSEFVNNIKSKEEKAEVTYLDKDGNEKRIENIASGDKLKIKTNREEKEYTIILYGDVNGDGKISAADYVAIKNHIMDVKKLSDYEVSAADANKDNKISAADYIAIKNHIMEVKEITQ